MAYELTALDATILSTLTASLLLGVLLLILFEVNRHVLDIYAPRLRDNSTPSPPQWRSGFLQWLHLDSLDKLQKTLNLDAWVVLHFIQFCIKLCVFTSVFGMIVLWPTYGTAEKEQDAVHGSSLYTMAHLDPGSPRLWVPTICTWVYTLTCIRMIRTAYKEFVDVRLVFLLRDDAHVKPQKRFTVMIKNLPQHLIASSAQLQDMFEELFPEKVYCANLVQSTKALERAILEREKILAELELATASYQASGQIRPTVRLINAPPGNDKEERLLPVPPKVVVTGMCSGICCVVGEQKDALDYYNIQLTEINMAIRRLRQENADGSAIGSTLKPSSSQSSILASEYMPPPRHSNSSSESESTDHCTDERFSNVSEDGVALRSKPSTIEERPSGTEALIQDIAASATAPIRAINSWASMAVKGSVLIEDKDIPTTTGFVTFLSRTAWLTAHRLGTLSDVYPDLCIIPAPDPEDVIWNNLRYSTKQSAQGHMLSTTILRAGLIFWGSLISFVTALSNLETLEEYLPFIENFNEITYAIVSGILPVTLMALLLASVPLAIAYIVDNLDHLPSYSAVQLKVFKWTFAYLLANMFVSIISGSIYRSLQDFADSPKLVLSYLAESFPATSVLFCNYMITVTLIAGPNELLQIIPLLQYAYLTKVKQEPYLTKRKLFSDSGPLCKKYYPYGGYLPQYIFVFTIVLLFAVINPLVPFVACFFFISRYYILRYQFLYVYTPQFSLGGQFWFDLHQYTMQGLLIFSVTMIMYTNLKQGFWQGIILLPLPFLIRYHWDRMDSTFGRLCQDIAYAKAMQDHAPVGAGSDQQKFVAPDDGHAQKNADSASFSKVYYSQPALLAPIDASPMPYRLNGQPLLKPVASGGGACNFFINQEVSQSYLTPLENDTVEEGVAPLVGLDFLDDDVETDHSKRERLKYTIDYSY